MKSSSYVFGNKISDINTLSLNLLFPKLLNNDSKTPELFLFSFYKYLSSGELSSLAKMIYASYLHGYTFDQVAEYHAISHDEVKDLFDNFLTEFETFYNDNLKVDLEQSALFLKQLREAETMEEDEIVAKYAMELIDVKILAAFIEKQGKNPEDFSQS